MDKRGSDYGLIFWVHFLLVVMIYLSPFLFKWGIIVLFTVLYYLQLLIVGECVLTKIQFNDKDITFYNYYLNKIGLRISRKKMSVILTFIIPVIILLITIIWQVTLKKTPLLI